MHEVQRDRDEVIVELEGKEEEEDEEGAQRFIERSSSRHFPQSQLAETSAIQFGQERPSFGHATLQNLRDLQTRTSPT